jgi:hypothetical protein
MKFGRLLWGVILLSIGIVLLGINLEWWDSTVWNSLFDLWPILIILLGIRVIFGGNNIITSIFLIIAVLLGILYISNYRDLRTKIEDQQEEKIETTEKTFSNDLSENIKSTKVNIELGAANINISGSSNNKLFEGSFSSSTNIKTKSTISDGVSIINISEDIKDFDISKQKEKRNFNIYLNKNLPTELKISSGASKYDLDLSSIKITTLEVNAGASNGQIKIGKEIEKVKVKIDAGASKTTILIPSEFSILVNSDSALIKDNFEEIGLKKDGDTFKSENFTNNTKQIEIKLSAGASTINIERY